MKFFNQSRSVFGLTLLASSSFASDVAHHKKQAKSYENPLSDAGFIEGFDVITVETQGKIAYRTLSAPTNGNGVDSDKIKPIAPWDAEEEYIYQNIGRKKATIDELFDQKHIDLNRELSHEVKKRILSLALLPVYTLVLCAATMMLLRAGFHEIVDALDLRLDNEDQNNKSSLSSYQQELYESIKSFKGVLRFPKISVFSDQITDRAKALANLLETDEDPLTFASALAEEDGLSYFLCEISRELMENPIIVSSKDGVGFNYDLTSAVSWFNRSNVLPATNEPVVTGTKAILNFQLKKQIIEWLDRKIEAAKVNHSTLSELMALS